MKLHVARGLYILAAAVCLASLRATASSAAVTQVPIAGDVLKARASQSNPAGRRMTFRSAIDPAIATPFPDPTLGASLLVFASSASGQCRAEVSLPAIYWEPLGGDGPNRGWRYLDDSASASGVRKVVIKPRHGGGVIVVKASGPGFPCGLEANAQHAPVAVALRVDDTRYCASFGGASVTKNHTGLFKAEEAAAPAACPDDDFSVADLNILHGIFCPGATAQCRVADRLALLGQWIVERGCPDAVTLQEVPRPAGSPIVGYAESTLATICPSPYEVVYQGINPFDGAIILSRHPVLSFEGHPLYGNVRDATHALIDHPIGAIDFFSTHLASGSDFATQPCGTLGACPQECIDAGAATVRDCQAVQLAALVQATHTGDAPAFIAGDFNSEPGSFVYQQMVDPGWTDTFLAAGNAECVPATGVGCTSGREDEALTDLESPALNQDERIDFIFVVPPGGGSLCAGTLDSPLDADGDGVATKLFADEPNPFSPSCGASPDPICWPSDHTGVQADLNCE